MRTALAALAFAATSGSTLAEESFDFAKLRASLDGETIYAADAHRVRAGHAGDGPAISGRLEASVGYAKVNEEGFQGSVVDLDGTNGALRGSVNVNGGAFNGQIDGFAKMATLGALETNAIGGTVHAYYRPAGGSYAVGAFATTSRTDADTSLTTANVVGNAATIAGAVPPAGGVVAPTAGAFSSETSEILGGLEAAALTQHATFFLRGGYGRADLDVPTFPNGANATVAAGAAGVTTNAALVAAAPALLAMGTLTNTTGNPRMEVEADRYQLAAGARLFAGQSLRFDFQGSVDRYATDNAHIDLYAFETKAVYRKPGAPYSLFAGLRRTNVNSQVAGVANDGGGSINTLFAGARFNFGDRSLREQDSHGALWEDTPGGALAVGSFGENSLTNARTSLGLVNAGI